jgi:hypothetical protein
MTTKMRASDADRQLVADRLAAHREAGRLTLSEYDERLAKAYSAVYRDDLDALFVDLPGGGPGFTGDDGTAQARPGFPGCGEHHYFARAPFDVRDAAASLWESTRRPERGRIHPALLVLGVIGGLLLLGALIHVVVHLVIPVLVIGAIVLFISRRHGARIHRDAAARPSR